MTWDQALHFPYEAFRPASVDILQIIRVSRFVEHRRLGSMEVEQHEEALAPAVGTQFDFLPSGQVPHKYTSNVP